MAVEVRVPALGESIVEATVGKWLKGEGETVTAGEALVELETDKVNIEVPSPEGGVLSKRLQEEGAVVNVGDVIAVVDATASAQAPAAVGEAKPSPAVREAEDLETAASPHVRRLAVERGIDLTAVAGTGPRGRVTEDDVLRAAQAAAPASAEAPRAPETPAPVPSPVSPTPAQMAGASSPVPSPDDGTGREERVRMSRRRQTIAKRLLEARQSTAMLTTFNEVDMSAILALRAERKEAFKADYGVSLGFMSFFTRAVVSGLKAFPRLNAEIDGDTMIVKRHYDIGIAVSTDEGLVVPVLREADRLSFPEIEAGISALAKRAREGSLTLADLAGGTFTITNGGVFGSLFSTPILNHPQVGILGMHTIQERPVAVNGRVEVRPMMYVAVSYDHRIVDGAESVQFLVHVKKLLEDPLKLLIEG